MIRVVPRGYAHSVMQGLRAPPSFQRRRAAELWRDGELLGRGGVQPSSGVVRQRPPGYGCQQSGTESGAPKTLRDAPHDAVRLLTCYRLRIKGLCLDQHDLHARPRPRPGRREEPGRPLGTAMSPATDPIRATERRWTGSPTAAAGRSDGPVLGRPAQRGDSAHRERGRPSLRRAQSADVRASRVRLTGLAGSADSTDQPNTSCASRGKAP